MRGVRLFDRIRLWPPTPDDRSGVPIGAGGTQRSGWPGRVLVVGVRARSDR